MKAGREEDTMTVEVVTEPQGITEKPTYPADYTDSLPSGITVTDAVCVHIPPTGGTVLVVTPTISTPYVYCQFGPLGALALKGWHILSCLATFSNGDKQEIRFLIPVKY
jgi:hypothetical protein